MSTDPEFYAEKISRTINERKSQDSNNLIERFFIFILGADAQIVSLLTHDQKRKLVGIGWQFLFLWLIVLSCGLIYLTQIFNGWAASVLFLLFAFFSYLVANSLSLRVFHNDRLTERRIRIHQVLIGLITLLFLCLGYVGLNSIPIREKFRAELYSKANADYLRALENNNQGSEIDFSILLQELYNYNKKQSLLSTDYKIFQRKYASFISDDIAKIENYKSLIDPNSEVSVAIDTTVGAKSFEVKDPSYFVNLSFEHYQKLREDLQNNRFEFISNSDGFFQTKGIQFVVDGFGRPQISKNFNDSLLLYQLRLAVDEYIASLIPRKSGFNYFDDSVMINNRIQDPFIRVPDSILTSLTQYPRYKASTDSWLSTLIAAEQRKLTATQWAQNSAAFIFTNNGWVILLVTIVICFQLITFIPFNIHSFGKGGYADLVAIYKRKQAEWFEESLKTTSEIYLDSEDVKLTQQEIDNLRFVNTPQHYFTSGEILERKGNMDEAIEKYLNGYKRFPEQYVFLDKVAKAFRKLGNDYQYDLFRERYTTEMNRITHQTNLSNDIAVQTIEFISHPFYGNMTWRLDAKMNVLLGKNGYGKSHLLSILLSLLQNDKKKADEFTPNASTDSEIQLFVSSSRRLELSNKQRMQIDSLADEQKKSEKLDEFNVANQSLNYSLRKGLHNRPGKIPVLAIPDTRFIDKSNSTLKGNPEIDFVENAALHFIQQRPYAEVLESALAKFCQNYLESGKKDSTAKTLIEDTFKILTGETLIINNIRSTDNAGYEMLITTESSNIALPIQKVSQGTFSVISVVLIIYNYLRLRYKTVPETELLHQHAIVLIDELDAHLHPSWQQKIVNILHRSFPNVQFIITAHSPLVVAGCKEDEVSVLRKSNGNFELQHYGEDFIGYPPEELYRIIFEIEAEDEAFARYSAMIPFEGEMKEKVNALERLPKPLSDDDRRALNQLHDDLYYIAKVKERSGARANSEHLKEENLRLKFEMEQLKTENVKQVSI